MQPGNIPRAIGALNEKPLHATLKAWYAQPGDQLESPVDGYVIDLVRGDLLIEIQARNFAALKRKLLALVPQHPVRQAGAKDGVLLTSATPRLKPGACAKQVRR